MDCQRDWQTEPTFQSRQNVWQIRILNSAQRNIILGTSKRSYIRNFERAGKETLKRKSTILRYLELHLTAMSTPTQSVSYNINL
jgi:hypothetical protein